VLGPVLPLSAFAPDVVLPVIVIYVIVVVVDVEVAIAPAATPTPAAAPGCAQRKTSAPCQTHSRVITGIFIRIVRILGLAVHDHRIVGWNVDNLRISLLNNDYLFAAFCFGLDFLLGAGFQRAFAFGFGAHSLDCVHHVGLLG
jgi:hypothetical protein